MRQQVSPGEQFKRGNADVLDHLEAWEPGTLPAAVRIYGPAFTVETSSDVTPATRSLLAAYAASRLDFHVMECADAE